MFTRTPLSTKAKPWQPQPLPPRAQPSTSTAETCGSKQTLTFVGYMAFETTVFATDTVTQDYAENAQERQQTAKPHLQIQRGRKLTTEPPQRLPSRTPSPSAWSVCLSEVSTEAGKTSSQAGSFTCTSAADLNECLEDSPEDFVVKNTFIDSRRTADNDDGVGSPKLSRCHSAPVALLSCDFKVYTTADLHEMGRCKPCAYLHGKADGCRRGSECSYCHDCPADELKTRKKSRMKAIKARRAALRAEQAALADPENDIMSYD